MSRRPSLCVAHRACRAVTGEPTVVAAGVVANTHRTRPRPATATGDPIVVAAGVFANTHCTATSAPRPRPASTTTPGVLTVVAGDIVTITAARHSEPATA